MAQDDSDSSADRRRQLQKWGAVAFSRLGEATAVFWTIAIILLVLWALGVFVVPIGGGLIHLLLVIALLILVYRLATGRKPIP